MKTKIVRHDAESRTVDVTFTQGETTYTRPVNACYTDSVYDAPKTRERVADVALGVAVKIGLGVIAVPEAVTD